MKRILIITALSQELNAIKSEIKKLKIPNIKISYLSTGIGNYNMILNLTRFLEKNEDFDFLINVGVCGYKDEKKDFFQVARIFNYSNGKELIIPKLLDFGDLGSIFCSEKVVFNTGDILEENFVDMESYGFEIVCDNFSIPRVILKVPIDKIGEETKNFDFKKSESFLKKNIDYKLLLEKIFGYLSKNTEEIDFSTYFKYYDFTFSEKIIFRKLFFKYNALVGEGFLEFFNKNKKLSKKEFLSYLEDFLKNFIL